MTPTAPPRLAVKGVGKTFTMHLQGGLRLPVFAGVDFAVRAGECVALGGRSGVGKSSLLKMAFGSYAVDRGSILLWPAEGGAAVDIASAGPRAVLKLRATTIAYVSQFLRVVPRVGALDIVAEPIVAAGATMEAARERAAALLLRLNLPERLWPLPPATFSGGEQQRVNVARGFATGHPLLLVDEPTASLDTRNRDVVIDMIAERKRAGAAVLGIFHDAAVREAVADRTLDVEAFAPEKAAA